MLSDLTRRAGPQKRKAYYKKQNYKIIVTENSLYESDDKNGCWLTAYNPKIKSTTQIVGKDNDVGADDAETELELVTNVTNRKQPILNGTCFL